jgi:hypothetical protein
MKAVMIIENDYILEDSGNADQVERFDGTYDGKKFELDRVSSSGNGEDDWLVEVEWFDGDARITDEEKEIIIERFWDMDYD